VAGPLAAPGIQEIQDRTRERIYGFFLVARIIVAPLIASFAIWLMVSDSVPWRRVTMAVVATAVLTVSVVDLAYYRRTGIVGPYAVPRNILTMGVASLFMVFATGALESPFLFVFVLVALGNAVFAPGRLGVGFILAIQIPMLWLFAALTVYGVVPNLVPDLFGGGARTARSDVLLWTTALFLTAILLAIMGFGTRLRREVDALVREQLDLRDESLRLHAEQSRALTTLAGEIAHELKNPLASVKGLSALVAKELEGRAADRMDVLRREVDRMQSILQEFLNFSRPLVPLAHAPVDLERLCDEVVELHAGVAMEREVRIAVRSEGDVELVCDARKIEQVLINLLQNSLEVAPAGSEVVIEVTGRDKSEARVRILDRGPGLPAEIADRVFEAGVTGRPDGSGLGLPVARQLARQHGGDLTLGPRPGGGCVAELVLPRAPVGDGPAEVEGGSE